MESDSATVAREEAQDCSCQAGRGSVGTYPSAMRILLTGMSESGKSTLVQELRRRGYAAYDADDDGFSGAAPGTRAVDAIVVDHENAPAGGRGRWALISPREHHGPEVATPTEAPFSTWL